MNKKYLAAVSGGPDSMALLDIYKKNIKVAIHVNYQKRVDSDCDEKIVESFCKTNKIDFVCLKVSSEMYANTKNNNFQAAARSIRYEYFQLIAKKYNLFDIYVAHHLDDFLETALMQKARESKNFFYGIKKNSNYLNLIIHRPLINCSKNMLLSYCKKNNINYAVDSTNETDVYERNRIRKEIINKSYFAKFIMKNNFQLMNFFLKSKYNKTIKLYEAWKKVQFNNEFFKKLNLKYKKYIIYYFLKNNNFDKITLSKIELIVDFIDKGSINKKLRLKENIFLKKTKNNIEIITIGN